MSGSLVVHPICLPPYGPVDWAMTQDNSTAAMVPFQDMDCVSGYRPEVGVPHPTSVQGGRGGSGNILSPVLQAGWLRCHPNKFSVDPYADKDINIMGKNSFITGFGSLAHPLPLTGQAPHGGARVCRSSPYSPGNNVFR